MVTYAKRPPQSDRLGQAAHRLQSAPTAPALDATSRGDVAMETTLSPSGAMVPAIRLNRAAQSSGSGGRSSERQAVSKTSVAADAGIGTSSMSDVGHTAAPVPQRSSSTESYILNPNRKRLSAFSDYNLKDFNPAAFAGLLLITLSAVTVVFGAAVFFGWLASVVFQ